MPPKEFSAEIASSSRKKGDSRSESENQKLRHYQQRLLLLHHAANCQHQAGECPVTPHCASAKRLWGHMAHCKNNYCSVQHCWSSRYVLTHCKHCKDPLCLRCGPVREVVRKSKQRVQVNPADPPVTMIAAVPVAVAVVMAPIAVYAVPAARASQPKQAPPGNGSHPSASRHPLDDHPSNSHDAA